MSYLVLARKYRPQSFEEVIGQAHITELFKKSIEAGRIAHAFLFCGPRGIGKTSCARILAKSLNCQEGPTLNPCGKCFACTEIANGNSFDVIEIDGASNRGIDEIRTLRENVKFAPTYGRYKVYIIDEVHMLTSEAFNALLKTLEEPPDYVKFIFATTEANKVPATILSRCQRFDFKRIAIETTITALRNICVKEGLKVDDEALFAISKASQGSMRDALSVLDQLSALGDQGVVSADVFAMLGMVETELLFQLTDALVARNCAEALNIFNQIIDRGKDIKQLGKDLTEHFRHMMIVKIGGPSLSGLIDYPATVKQRLQGQADKITVGGILKALELFIEAQETARVMETLRMPLELAFAKLTYGKEAASAPAAVAVPAAASVTRSAVSQAPTAAVSQSTATAKPMYRPPTPAASIKPQAVLEPVTAPASNASVIGGSLSFDMIKENWNALTHEVSTRKMSLATYLQDGVPHSFKEGKLTIAFAKDHSFQKECLEQKENSLLIEQVFSQKLGAPIFIGFKIADLTASSASAEPEEPVLKNALEMFGGKVVKEWHSGKS